MKIYLTKEQLLRLGEKLIKENDDGIDLEITNFLEDNSELFESNLGDVKSPFMVYFIKFKDDKGRTYSVNSLMSKKASQRVIIDFLEDTSKIDSNIMSGNRNVLNKDRQKIIKTIKHFMKKHKNVFTD